VDVTGVFQEVRRVAPNYIFYNKIEARNVTPNPAKTCAAVLLIVLASISNGHAWVTAGHRVVAELAEQFLEISTARQVRDLLALENVTTLAHVSMWADQIRLQRPETGPWHFVNIPIHPASGTLAAYDRERDCPQDNCVVAKIDQFARDLSDQNAPPRQRLEALKFLTHFVADIHQPLHCANNNDRGGNDTWVELNGKPTTLHAVWDASILAPAVNLDERAYALSLARSITDARRTLWRGSPPDWANESYEIAATVIYKRQLDPHDILPMSYAADMLPIVNERLQRAGVRLAKILNAALAFPGLGGSRIDSPAPAK
jgi:S1/P1 Nuclease